MNKNQYRLVFSKKLDMLVAVAEITSAQGKAVGQAALMGIGLGVGLLGLSLAVSNVFAQTSLLSTSILPTAPTTTTGLATYVTSGKTLTVTQSTQNLGTNWQSFSVGQGNTVIFKQPNASSISVNRVIGTDRSEIYGSIQANGQVFLLNSNGVLFGRTAQVDVAGLLATTKTISNAEMAAGNFNQLRLIGASGAGLTNVTNLGNISASGANGTGGYVVFAADQIFNDGTIKAKGGQIIMAAGATLDMSIEEAGSIHVKASEATIQALIDNKGLMVADGGQIILTASGKNTLLNTVINNSGTLQAKSASVKNGVIVLDGGSAGVGGDVMSTGVIDVSGYGAGEKGGVAILTGDRIALTGTASIDASGDAGGGRVVVGGDLLKKASDIMDVKIAAQTVITQGVNISIGSKNGDGGFVETSGNSLTMSGSINGAAKGKSGLWLIDPTDLIIQASGVEVNTTGSPAIFQNTSSATTSTVSNASIVDALNTTDVLVTTAGGGAANGNISINADIIKTGAGVSNLTFLTASGRIELNSSIASTGGMLGLNLTANSNSLEAVRIRSTGSINVTGVLTINGTSNTNNEFAHGAVTIEGNVNASNSQNTITGTGAAKNYSGVWFKGGSQSINGNITGVSLNALSYSSIAGVIFDGGDQTLNGAIIGSSATSNGVQFSGGNQVINGSVAGSASSLSGVQFSSGNQIINGNVAGTASAFSGVNFFGSNVTLTGSVNGVSSTNFGVNFSIGNQTINGDVMGTSGSSIGVRFVNGVQVINANVTGNSSSSFGVSFNNGNQTLNGAIVGNSNTGGGVRFSAGNQTFSGNTTVTGSSNQASGITFIGGTQNITSSTGQGINITGVTLNSSGASNIYGLNISGALNLTTAGGSVGLYGTANAGSGVFINANVTSLNASSIISGSSSTGTGINFNAGNHTIAGSVNGSSNSNVGLIFSAGNRTLSGNLVGTSNSAVGLNFFDGNSTITGNATGQSNTGVGVLYVGGNNTISGNTTGQSNTNAGINYTGGNNNVSGNVTGLSNQGIGVYYDGGNHTFSGNVTGSSNIESGVRFDSGSNTLILGNMTGQSNTVKGIYFRAGNQTINGNLTGLSNNDAGVYFLAGNQTLNANVAGLSNTNVGVYFVGGNQTVNANITGTSNTSLGVYFNGGNQTVNADVIGIGSVGVRFSSGNQTLNANVTGTSNTSIGVYFAGGTQRVNANVTGVSNSSTGVAIASGSIVVTGSLNIVANSSTGSGFVQTGGSITGVGNLSILANQTSSLGSINLTTGASGLIANVTNGNLILDGNLSSGKSISLMAGSQYAAGVSTGGDVTVGTALNITANTSGAGGTISIYSGTPNTANANTSVYSGVVSGETAATTSKTYNRSVATITNASQILNVFYRIAPNLTITAGNNSKVFDATNNTASGNYTVTGLTDGDTVNTSASGGITAYASATAGTGLAVNVVNTTLTMSNAVVAGYNVNQTINAVSGVISKAAVTIATNGTVSSKVFDTTVSAVVISNSSGTVALGNSTAANGSTSSSNFSAINTSATFANASAGVQIINLTDALRDTLNYTLIAGANAALATGATISKANVTITTNGSVSNKVFDMSTSSAITTNATGTVQLGNAALANGSVNSSVGFTAINTTSSFTNASAGMQTVNLTAALRDTTNYTIVGGSSTKLGTSSATISKANVTITTNGSVSNKVFDNTTNTSITTNASGTVQLGNAALANGSVNSSSSFAAVTTSAVFTNASAGMQIVNLTAVLQDTINYTIAGATMRIGTNSAVISPAPSPAATNTSSGLSGALVGGGSSSNITSAQADATVVNLQSQIKNTDELLYAEDGGAIDFAMGSPRGGAASTGNNFVPLGGRGEPQKNEPPKN